MLILNNLCVCVCFCVAEGKPPAAPTGIHASETDRTYVVLSWKAPAYSSKAPIWYYIEKVLSPMLPCILHCILLGSRLRQLKNARSYIFIYMLPAMHLLTVCPNTVVLLGWETKCSFILFSCTGPTILIWFLNMFSVLNTSVLVSKKQAPNSHFKC